MVSYIRTIFFCSILAVSTVFSISPEKNRTFPALFKNASNTVTAPLSAQRLAKSAALTWKQTGTMQFNNSGTDSFPVWELSSRDTTIYDAAGNIVLEMSSTAESGWDIDSLSSIDSTVYSNGKVVETVLRNFDRNYFGTLTSYAYRTTNTYLNSGKTLLSISYNWDDSAKTWVPSDKDSIVFSLPVIGSYGLSDLTNLTGVFMWQVDSAGSGWISRGFYQKVEGESTPTRFVLVGKTSFGYISDSLIDEKLTLVFSSPVWTENHMVEQIVQRKYSPSGAFVNYSRYAREVNTDGWQIRMTEFDWDTTKSVWVGSYHYIHFPDRHGNDTLHFSADFDTATSVWDTNSRSRYLRTYDASGNNTGILSYSYNDYNGTWRLTKKTINTFAQINQSVKVTVKPAEKQSVTVRVSPASVTFAGPNIERVDLYNAAGRPVLSVRQKPGAMLRIYPAQSMVPTGVYIGRIRTSSGTTSLRLPLCQ